MNLIKQISEAIGDAPQAPPGPWVVEGYGIQKEWRVPSEGVVSGLSGVGRCHIANGSGYNGFLTYSDPRRVPAHEINGGKVVKVRVTVEIID